MGKSTIFRHLRKTPLPGRRDYKQISSQGGSISRDCCKFSFMTDSAEIRVSSAMHIVNGVIGVDTFN